VTRLLALALTLAAAPAAADDLPAFLYEQFEAAVPHIDLDTCPPSLAAPGRFCRLTLNGDALHVFAFREDGERPFVAVQTFYEDEFTLAFGR
jgi:hypothetical protein